MLNLKRGDFIKNKLMVLLITRISVIVKCHGYFHFHLLQKAMPHFRFHRNHRNIGKYKHRRREEIAIKQIHTTKIVFWLDGIALDISNLVIYSTF